LTVYGDGSQSRAFCYVDDLVEGLIRMMQSSDDITGPLNMGNPRESRIIDLAEQIIALTGSSSRIVRQPLPKDDPKQRCPDISKAMSLLHWHPTVELTQGLKRTTAYFEAILRTTNQ
jgi:UDP-glucuronate decarboxylase